MGLELGGGLGWGAICCGLGWGEPKEHVKEPIREFWRKTTFHVREEQSLQRSLEGMMMREEENEGDGDLGTRRRAFHGTGSGAQSQVLQRGEQGKGRKGHSAGSWEVTGTLSKSIFSGSGDVLVGVKSNSWGLRGGGWALQVLLIRRQEEVQTASRGEGSRVSVEEKLEQVGEGGKSWTAGAPGRMQGGEEGVQCRRWGVLALSGEGHPCAETGERMVEGQLRVFSPHGPDFLGVVRGQVRRAVRVEGSTFGSVP